MEPTYDIPAFLPSHTQRVCVELKELMVKIKALSEYINLGCPGASEEEKLMLHEQLVCMGEYSNLLKYRLELYELELYEPKLPDFEVIFAISRNKVFGKDGGIPWKSRSDMQHFKDTTTGGVVIMGSKTFESLPRGLPSREIIVVSSKARPMIEGLNINVHITAVFPNLDSALLYVKENKKEKVFVIGGKELIREALPKASAVHISIIDTEIPIDEKTTVLDFVSVKQFIGTSDQVKDTEKTSLFFNSELLKNCKVKVYAHQPN